MATATHLGVYVMGVLVGAWVTYYHPVWWLTAIVGITAVTVVGLLGGLYVRRKA